MTANRPQRISPTEPPGSLPKRITVATDYGRAEAEHKGGDPAHHARSTERRAIC